MIVKLFDYNPFKKDKNAHGLTTALIVTLVERAFNNNVELKTLVMVIGTIIKQEERKKLIIILHIWKQKDSIIKNRDHISYDSG